MKVLINNLNKNKKRIEQEKKFKSHLKKKKSKKQNIFHQ